MNGLKRLAKLGLVLVIGSYLVGCVIAPHGGWGHGRHHGSGGSGGYGGYGGYGGHGHRH